MFLFHNYLFTVGTWLGGKLNRMSSLLNEKIPELENTLFSRTPVWIELLEEQILSAVSLKQSTTKFQTIKLNLYKLLQTYILENKQSGPTSDSI